MKIVIIDSNQSDIKKFCTYINLHFSGANIIANALDIETGKQAITDFNPEVVFMDIDFPDGNAFDLLNEFEYIYFKIVFITKDKDSFIKAIRYRIFDYIAKPFELNEIKYVFERLKSLDYKDENLLTEKINLSKRDSISGNYIKKIILSTDNSIYVVDIDDIMYCKADYGYTIFYLTNNTEIMVTRTLKEFDDLLSPYTFIRTHKSFLVNFKFIKKFSYEDGGMIFLKTNASIPVSFRKRDLIIKTITSLALN